MFLLYQHEGRLRLSISFFKLNTDIFNTSLLNLHEVFTVTFSLFLGTSYSPQENSHNHSALHSSNSHSSNPSNNPSKTSDAVSIFYKYSNLPYVVLYKHYFQYFRLNHQRCSFANFIEFSRACKVIIIVDGRELQIIYIRC